MASGYSGEWWEYQANQCMACLLLPRYLLVPRFKAVLTGVGARSFEQAAKQAKDVDIVRSLANMFDVSWQTLLYRLEELGFIPNRDQLDQGNMARRVNFFLTLTVRTVSIHAYFPTTRRNPW